MLEKKQTRRGFIRTGGAAAAGIAAARLVKPASGAEIAGRSRMKAMKEIPESSKYLVAKEEGWYLGFTGVAVARDGLVCAYIRTDQHVRTITDLMVARSEDGGRTWKGHQSLSHQELQNDGAIWVSPEISSLRDGRNVIICDHDDWKGGKGHPSSNQLFWSSDGGHTWSRPQKTDDIAGEPERIRELSDGTLMYTTSKAAWQGKRRYLQCIVIFSDDGGKTWDRQSILSDDPLYQDCEVGVVEVTPGKLLAVSRCGDPKGGFGQPSRFIFSSDYGKTWGKPILAPVHGHRTIPGMLKSGKILVTYRNCFGTNATYAFVFEPGERFSYQPNSFIWDESRCTIEDGVMAIRTDEGTEGAVDFVLYPARDDSSRVEVEAELMVQDADIDGCCIGAGCWVQFQPGRVCLADRPEDGFELDANRWHSYRIIRQQGEISIFVDGQLSLKRPIAGIANRLVHFGNRHARPKDSPIYPYHRQYDRNRSLSRWRSVSVRVENRDDHSMDWKWEAKDGYPDQFRRDRLVLVDRSNFTMGDNGYSGWTQTEDGTVVIADYTCGSPPAEKPFIRSYVVGEEDLIP